MIPHPIEAVLFDLDGTFADTAADLAFALNRTLEKWHKTTLSFENIRPVVSQGGIALIRLGFGMEPGDPGFEDRRQFLLRVYQDNICRQTRLFEGMEFVLSQLEDRNIPWGIVTNKPSWLTDPLMAAMCFDDRAACIVSGDTCSERKPHPAPLLYACEQIGVNPANTLYVGDDERDIIAGKAAGNTTIAARYGYIPEGQNPDDWGADKAVDSPAELLQLLGFVDQVVMN